MKALSLLLLCSCLGPSAASGTDLPNWPALKLVNGKEYHDAKVTVVEAGGIKIMHAAGVSRVPETLLPPEIRALFTFDPGRAAIEEQERRAQDQAARERTAAIMKAQRARDAAAAALESMEWKYKVVKVGEVLGNGAYLCYPHTEGGRWARWRVRCSERWMTRGGAAFPRSRRISRSPPGGTRRYI